MHNIMERVPESLSKLALAHATELHKGQFRSDNVTEYIRHPERVAEIVKQFKKSHNIHALLSAAYLHDTIEDTDATFTYLEKTFGGLIANIVQELTTDEIEKEKVGKTVYLSRKMSKMSPWALVIKLADRLDNVSDIETAKNEAWRLKYKRQTLDIIKNLRANRKLSSTHKKLIRAIEEKLARVADVSSIH